MQIINELAATRLDYFILIFLRISGLIFSSPIFGRRNIPNTVKIGLCGTITILLCFGQTPQVYLEYNSLFMFAALCITELLFGVILGYVQNLFFSIPQTAGTIIDMQMGFGMANIYDMQSGVSVPMMGTFLNYTLLMIFFAVDGHLRIIQMLTMTFTQVPIGRIAFSPELGMVALELFSKAFVLSVSVAMPIIASGLLGEAAMGVIIRTVPQMNMFVVGMPVKVLLGFLVMVITLPAFVDFSSVVIETMFQGIEAMFMQMLSG